jgi:hypothetical protein
MHRAELELVFAQAAWRSMHLTGYELDVPLSTLAKKQMMWCVPDSCTPAACSNAM